MITVTFRGTNYSIPEPGDAFAQALTDYLNALSTGAVPYPTTADVDLGAAFGLKAAYFKTRTANPSASGLVRQAVSDALAWRNNANGADLSLGVNSGDQLTFAGIPISRGRVAPTYGATVAINAALGDQFVITATNGTAFTINNPTNGVTGQRITIRIRNASGGVLGAVTWDTTYKLSAWTSPANGFSRAIVLDYDGAAWIEAARTPADVPN